MYVSNYLKVKRHVFHAMEISIANQTTTGMFKHSASSSQTEILPFIWAKSYESVFNVIRILVKQLLTLDVFQ